jgi:hypothetical protein
MKDLIDSIEVSDRWNGVMGETRIESGADEEFYIMQPNQTFSLLLDP